MKTEITKVFEGHNVRIATEGDAPLFHLGDVFKAVGSKSETHKVIKSVEEDDRFSKPVIDSMGRKQDAWYINEMGLIELLTILRVPKTKEFRRWALREVIPSVLKTGSYSVEPKRPESKLEWIQFALETEKARLELEQRNKEIEPKATAYNTFLDSGGATPHQ